MYIKIKSIKMIEKDINVFQDVLPYKIMYLEIYSSNGCLYNDRIAYLY